MNRQWDNESKEALIAYRIQRADETLQEAELMFNEQHYHGAINRLYYACYYVVMALLLKSGIEAHTHAGVKTMFALHFVSKGIVPYEIGKVFSTLFEKRQAGDYDDFIICERSDVEEYLGQTRSFITNIKSLI